MTTIESKSAREKIIEYNYFCRKFPEKNMSLREWEDMMELDDDDLDNALDLTYLRDSRDR